MSCPYPVIPQGQHPERAGPYVEQRNADPDPGNDSLPERAFPGR